MCGTNVQGSVHNQGSNIATAVANLCCKVVDTRVLDDGQDGMQTAENTP